MLLHLAGVIPGIASARISPSDSTNYLVAGFRASRILSNYPNDTFPSPQYWVKVGRNMAQKFVNGEPGGVWIVSLYQDNGVTELNFPSGGKSYPYIMFSNADYNEPYLDEFDKAGLKVWLQVEPGAADVNTLIDLVMRRYNHHVSVIGFGIDVEWYYRNISPEGRMLTDTEAQQWEQRVKSIDSGYTLFLKHYNVSWMPPSYRGSILFIDDSQHFRRSVR